MLTPLFIGICTTPATRFAAIRPNKTLKMDVTMLSTGLTLRRCSDFSYANVAQALRPAMIQ